MKRQENLLVSGIVMRYLGTGNRVIEFMCGGAPISSILKKQNADLHLVGVDYSDEMSQRASENLSLFQKVDMSQRVDLSEHISEVGVVVNGLYAVTVPSEKNRLSVEEQHTRRINAIENMANAISCGGYLVVDEPLASARNLSLVDQIKAAGKEVISRLTQQIKGNKDARSVGSFFQELRQPEIIQILRYNRALLNAAHLYESVEEMVEDVTHSGYFEIEEVLSEHSYLGHNALVAFRRTDKEIAKAETEVTDQFYVEILESDTREYDDVIEQVGPFIQEAYSKTDVDQAVPVRDKFDSFPGNLIAVVRDNKGEIIATARVHVPVIDKSGENYEYRGMEMLEILKILVPIDNEVIEKASQAWNENESIGHITDKMGVAIDESAELRRFVVKDGVDSQKVVRELFSSLGKKLKLRNIRAICYIADDVRTRRFGSLLADVGIGQLNRLSGLGLRMEDPRIQLLCLRGYRYFLSRGEIRKELTVVEQGLLKKISETIGEETLRGNERAKVGDWEGIINDRFDEDVDSDFLGSILGTLRETEDFSNEDRVALNSLERALGLELRERFGFSSVALEGREQRPELTFDERERITKLLKVYLVSLGDDQASATVKG